jgi:hypothetical protein
MAPAQASWSQAFISARGQAMRVTTEFDKIADIEAYCDELRAIAKVGAVDAALEAIAQFVVQVISRETSWATVFSSPELDALCQELGRLSSRPPIVVMDQDRAVFLVTGIAGVGGHTRVLMDLVKVDPAARKTVLVSNVLHDLSEDEVREILHRLDSSIEVEVAPKGTVADALVWLQQRLATLRPARSYILQHHFDAAITAAVQPEITGKLFYYHNCDHSLALGIHLPHATHIDFNGKSYHHCRTVKGVQNGVFWPLVAEVSQHRAHLPFLAHGCIISATSGGLPKFDLSYLIEWVPYRHDYKMLVPLILRATGGMHIHIGPLKEDVLQFIRANIAAAGIDPLRFIHLSSVDDLASELVDRRVDLYIGSFPLGGGRATVEVMGAGIPLLLHNNYASVFYTDINEVYPDVLTWSDADQLTGILTGLDAEALAEHASRARAFYESRFTPEALRNAVTATLLGDPPAPPPPPMHFPNTLQRWLDQRATLASGHIRSSGIRMPPSGSVAEADAVAAAAGLNTKHIAAILFRRVIVTMRRRLMGRQSE